MSNGYEEGTHKRAYIVGQLIYMKKMFKHISNHRKTQ